MAQATNVNDVVEQLKVFFPELHQKDITYAMSQVASPTDMNAVAEFILNMQTKKQDQELAASLQDGMDTPQGKPLKPPPPPPPVRPLHAQTTCMVTSNTIECTIIDRLVRCLRFFDSLDIQEPSEQIKLLQYFNTYPTLLDDYIHLDTHHNKHTQLIHRSRYLRACDPLKCGSLRRHHNQQYYVDEEDGDDEKMMSVNTGTTAGGGDMASFDPNLMIYLETLDGLHSYIYHLQDVYVTQSITPMAQQMPVDEDYDPELNELFGEIRQRRQTMTTIASKARSRRFTVSNQLQSGLGKMPSFGKQKTGKFAIHLQDESNEQQHLTMIDGLYLHLRDCDIPKYPRQQLARYLKQEEYDTDSLKEDVDINEDEEDEQKEEKKRDDDEKDDEKWSEEPAFSERGGNVFRTSFRFDSFMYKSIEEFLRTLSSESFSIGYIFYYWPYYKTLEIDKDEYFVNKNDHSGYTQKELYVRRKYGSLKEEVLTNGIERVSIKVFNKCYAEAFKYGDTEKCRSITSDDMDYQLFYGIPYGSELGVDNLVALLLYCNYSDIQRAFSETFRKKFRFESLASVKKRNAEFANWSRILRETVQYYGSLGWVKDNGDSWNQNHRRMKGPFYTGMNQEMAIPEIIIRLCSPTSTSTQREIAMQFAGDQGVVLVLNNNGYYHSEALRGFDCQWISKYKEEGEYLFIGGHHRIRIQSIITIRDSMNFEKWFRNMYYFDCMITGISMKKQASKIEHIKKNAGSMKQKLLQLVESHLEPEKQKFNIPSYVKQTFASFVAHKQLIVINLHQLNRYFSSLKYLILENEKQNKENKNVLNDVIFRTFKNINHLIIYTTNANGQKDYKFDVKSLIEVMKYAYKYRKKSEKRFKITVQAAQKYKFRDRQNVEFQDFSWIHKLWDDEQLWKFLFRENGFDISWKATHQLGHINVMQDTLTVTKTTFV